MRFAFVAFTLFASTVAFAGDEAFIPGAVTTRSTGAGIVFANAKDMTLYTYAQDSVPGKSACKDECAKVWPPLAAEADAMPKGDWSIITRDDDTLQWAFRGKPLYTYIRDRAPGVALGDRVGNAWRIAFDPIMTPPGIAIRSLFIGRILTDQHGMTLYTREDETKDKSACEAKCVDEWTPLSAPLLANDIGDWKAMARSDGTRQWSYQGRRLYLNKRDIKPGDIRGQGANKVWKVAVLDPAAPLPSWVTVQNSDMGEIFADAKGMTLYTFLGSMEKNRLIICNDDCMSKWKAVVADAGAKPSGEWTTIAAEGGELRWAYKGNVVYTHSRDKEPGAIGGDKWAAGGGGTGGGFFPIQRRRDYEE